MKNGMTAFIRKAFNEDKLIAYNDLCKLVDSNSDKISRFSKDYKHRVRASIFQLVKQGELVRIDKGKYKKI